MEPELRDLAIRHARVLLAEDDFEMRRLIAGALRKDGYEVIEVKDGEQLLTFIGSQLLRPRHAPMVDLIITDVRMPSCSGLTVVAGLRRADWMTPVIVITAFGDAETHAEARRLGATILDKPFDMNELRVAVTRLAWPH